MPRSSAGARRGTPPSRAPRRASGAPCTPEGRARSLQTLPETVAQPAPERLQRRNVARRRRLEQQRAAEQEPRRAECDIHVVARIGGGGHERLQCGLLACLVTARPRDQRRDAVHAGGVMVERALAERLRDDLELVVPERIVRSDRTHGPRRTTLFREREQPFVVARRGDPKRRVGEPRTPVHRRGDRRRKPTVEQLASDGEPLEHVLDQSFSRRSARGPWRPNVFAVSRARLPEGGQEGHGSTGSDRRDPWRGHARVPALSVEAP